MSGKTPGHDSSAASLGIVPWIAVDFDRTLALYTSWGEQGEVLGEPIVPNVARVMQWLESGWKVKIFTARAASTSPRREKDIVAIKAWCLKHLGVELEVTAEKDLGCVMIVDDMAFPVLRNVGRSYIRPDDAIAAFLPEDPISEFETQLIDTEWEHRTYLEADAT